MIGIINYHQADNYGAVLQSYALQNVIAECGGECEIIDYKCHFIKNHYKLIHFNSIRQLLSDIIYFFDHACKKRGFHMFRKKYLVLSKMSYSVKNIKDANKVYRVFITGSDQVFNYTNTGFDKTYFLDFVEKYNTKCAYAASFGFSEIPIEMKKIYIKLLTGFKYISFREQSGSRLYNKLTLDKAPTLLDPTLIANTSIWNFDVKLNLNNEPYILVYFLERSLKAFKFVNSLKRKTGMRVIYIGSLIKMHRCNLEADYMGDLSPDEFVYLFKNASYVVTNSFHGTAFSLIFNKQFWVNTLEYGKATNDRFISLLNQLDLNNRIIPNNYDCEYFSDSIDYNKVNSKLDLYRKQALRFIRKICDLDEVK